jgi:hypothetical protein
MSIKGFRIFDTDAWYETDFVCAHRNLQPWHLPNHLVKFHTGTYDRNNTPIYEGDTLRQMSCEQTFKVDDIVSFLLMCGRYQEKHGAPIFDSLEVVDEKED